MTDRRCSATPDGKRILHLLEETGRPACHPASLLRIYISLATPPGNSDTRSRVTTIPKLSAASFPEARLVIKMLGVSGQWSHEMERVILAFTACLTLVACGLGETAVSAAAGGASEAEQAKAALRTEARVKQQLDAAATLEAQRRQAADTSSQ